MDITITLTDAEAKAMSMIAADPTEWVLNLVQERARIAIEEIFQAEVQRMISDPAITEIPADREAIVMAYEPSPEALSITADVTVIEPEPTV